MKYIIFIFMFFCNYSHSSCTETFESNDISFSKSAFNLPELETLQISFPKSFSGKPFESISFNYQYAEQYILGNLAYKEINSHLQATVTYQKEYSKAVKITITYKHPGSECMLVYTYS